MSVQKADGLLTAPGQPFETEEATVGGVSIRVWKNAPQSLLDIFERAKIHGDAEFVAYEGERLSYRQFYSRSLAAAAQLRRRGFAQGDRIALVMPNIPEWPVAFFSACLIGAIPALINCTSSLPEIIYAVKNSGAKAAFVDVSRLPDIGTLREAANIELVVTCRGASVGLLEGTLPFDDLVGVKEESEEAADSFLDTSKPDTDAEAVIFYTSGTTGRPRGVLCSHRNLTSSIMLSELMQARAKLVDQKGEVPDQPRASRRVGLQISPLFHTGGFARGFLPTLASGGKLVFLKIWTAQRALQAIEKERVTFIAGVPTAIWQLIEDPKLPTYDLSSLEQIFTGGSPPLGQLAAEIKRRLPSVQPGNVWGLTETSGGCCGVLGDTYVRRPMTCGVPSPVTEIRIGDGPATAPPDVVGELWVKGPHVMQGYWRDEQADIEVLMDGWLKTGDLAYVDSEGYCFVVDRKKDMFIWGGENIYSIEIESALSEHPDVKEAAAVGVAHRTLGEEPAAVVVLEEDAATTVADLKNFLKNKLSTFKIPVKILLVRTPLPRNAGGKIIKTEVLKMIVESAQHS